MNALVIDHSKVMRTVLQGILVNRGFDVVEAESWGQAMASWNSTVPDVVLIDWDFQNPEVLEFVSLARRAWMPKSLFLMLMNSEPEPKKMLSAIMAGADHILVKPFTSSQLDAKLLEGRLAYHS